MKDNKTAITVVKVGGAVVEDATALSRLLTDFAAIPGRKILVHGGGRRATKVAEALGIKTTMVGGRRITDAAMLEVVTMVYGGLVNHGAGGGLVMAEFLKVAQGEYVKFFCADDIMCPDCLATLVGYMESHRELSFAFGDLAYVNVLGEDLGEHWFEARPKFSVDLTEVDCLRLFSIGHSFLPWIGSIVRREALSGIELDATLVMMFDMSVWVQLLLKGCRLAFVKSVVASYRIHGDQVSGLAHKSSAIRLSICERQVFFRFFQNCRDVALVKEIFAGDGFVQRLETIDDIPLAVALHYLSCDKRATWAYQYVHDCLQDPVRREAAESRMGITVAGFRDLVRSLADASRPRSMWVRFRDKWCR